VEATAQGNRLKGNVYVRVGIKIGCRRGKPPARDHVEDWSSTSDDDDFVVVNHRSGPIEVPKDSAPCTRFATRGGTKKAPPTRAAVMQSGTSPSRFAFNSHIILFGLFLSTLFSALFFMIFSLFFSQEYVSSPKGKKRKAGGYCKLIYIPFYASHYRE
jgi:hypothetical protein